MGCLCVCENTATENVTCCCCCPIKCGVQVIGSLTILLCFYYISWNFFLILNDQVTWWFPVVTIVLLVPLYVASGLFVSWFIKDSLGTRGGLTGAILLALYAYFMCVIQSYKDLLRVRKPEKAM